MHKPLLSRISLSTFLTSVNVLSSEGLLATSFIKKLSKQFPLSIEMSPNFVRIGLSAAAAGVCAVALTNEGQREDSTKSLMKIMSADDPKVKALEKREIVVVGGGVCGLSTAWKEFQF